MAKNFFNIDKGVNFRPQTSAPSDPRNGDFYYDSVLKKFRAYIDGAWGDVGSGSSSSFWDESDTGSQTLTDGTTAVLSALTYSTSTYDGAIIDYKIVGGLLSSEVRIGKLIVTNKSTTTVDFVDTYTETGPVMLTWSVAFNGTNVEISYTTSTVGSTRNFKGILRKILT